MYQFKKKNYEDKIYCIPLKEGQKSYYKNKNWSYLVRISKTKACSNYYPSTNNEEIFHYIQNNFNIYTDLKTANEQLDQIAKVFNLREISEEEIHNSYL